MNFISKDYSGIKVANKEHECYDCKKDILPGEKYLRQNIMGKIKIKCLSCRQKILDSL